MNVNIKILGWEDHCHGCNKTIKVGEEMTILSNIQCIQGNGIHLCTECSNKIVKEKIHKVIEEDRKENKYEK